MIETCYRDFGLILEIRRMLRRTKKVMESCGTENERRLKICFYVSSLASDLLNSLSVNTLV